MAKERSAVYGKGDVRKKVNKSENRKVIYFLTDVPLFTKFAPAYYNRACAYSLKGDKNSFLRDLKKSIELDPKLKDSARKDDDFKRIVE